jgi:hypothetical protein
MEARIGLGTIQTVPPTEERTALIWRDDILPKDSVPDHPHRTLELIVMTSESETAPPWGPPIRPW